MNVSQIEDKITSKTKAIMVVHVYELPVDMDAVIDIAQRYNLYIIEDCAEAHGLTYRGKQCGSFGTISAMSFYPNKHITTGEGGMVLVDDEQLKSDVTYLETYASLTREDFIMKNLGIIFECPIYKRRLVYHN